MSAPDFAARTDPIRAKAERSATLFAELDRREEELVITNLGPGTAQLSEVFLPDNPKDVFLDLKGIEDGQGIHLLAGDNHSIPAYAPGLQSPLKIEMTWHDRSGEQRRVQLIMDLSEHHRDAGTGVGSASVTTNSRAIRPVLTPNANRDGQ